MQDLRLASAFLAVDMKDLQLSWTLPGGWTAAVERDCLCGQVDLRVPVADWNTGVELPAGSQGDSLACGNRRVEVTVSGC